MSHHDSPNDGAKNLAEIREKIVLAASKIYEKKGRQATVEDIAAAAGISVPVTYQFVKKPADIMLLIMEHLQYYFAAGVHDNLNEGSPADEKLKQAIRLYYQVVDQQRPMVMLVYRSSPALDKEGRTKIKRLEREAVDIFRRIIDEGITAGLFKKVNATMVAYDIAVLGHMWSLKQWYFREVGMSLEDFITAQTNIIMPVVTQG